MGIRHDGELLARCADEPVTFEELVARHQASLIRCANRRLGPTETAPASRARLANAARRRKEDQN